MDMYKCSLSVMILLWSTSSILYSLFFNAPRDVLARVTQARRVAFCKKAARHVSALRITVLLEYIRRTTSQLLALSRRICRVVSQGVRGLGVRLVRRTGRVAVCLIPVPCCCLWPKATLSLVV